MSAPTLTPRLAVAVACLGLVVAGWPASRAPAAFPGQNDKIAYSRGDDIFVMNADGSAQTNRTFNDPTTARAPAWSADGTKIAFFSNRGVSANDEIVVMNADGSAQTNRTNNAAVDQDPAWSPTGQKIAFESNRGNFDDIYVMNADGSAQTRLTNDAAQDIGPAWSPDGTKIAFTSARDGNPEIYVMNAGGSAQTNRTNNVAGDSRPNWSPDGTKIAFASSRDGNEEIYVMNADGSAPTRLTNNVAVDGAPAWSPDGQKIAFTRGGEIFAVSATNPENPMDPGSAPTNLTNSAATESDPDWGPSSDRDGDALLDSWEEDGIDVDGDGTADLDLPAMGADPDHKDIFIEVDFMAGHQIAQAQIDDVTKAFKDAPVPNPDNKTGITLHVDNGPGSTMDPVSGSTWGSLSDQDTLAHQNVLGSDFTVGGQLKYDWSEFETIRQTNLLAIRRPAFHYVIAAHSGPSQRFAGISRGVTGGAADFIVAMHENCQPIPQLGTECTPDSEYTASTFMHEFGHNLSLQHGGTDEDARKPNYLSVMNYNFGWGLIVFDGVTSTSTSFELDYSRFSVPLNENLLNEQTGFGIDTGPVSAYKTIFRCPNSGPRYTIPFTTEQIDWNCDGTIFGSTGNVSSDASGNGTIGQLAGPIDWNRLVFSGGGIGALNQPPPPDDTVIDEPTPAELQANRDLLEHGTLPPIDPPAAAKPRNEFSFGKVKRNKRKGTAKLTVNVPGPGTVELAQGKKLKGDETQAEAAGEATLVVKPKGKAKKKLSSKGKAKVGADVTYTPDGGTPNTQTASVKLVRK